MRKTLISLALLAAVVPAAQASSLAKAQYLAATCANCHGTNGQSVGGSVSLAGYDREKFISTMKAFREGKQEATLMHQLAKGYTDEQVAALAEFFSSQKSR